MLPYGIGTVNTIMKASGLSQKQARTGLAKLRKLEMVALLDSAGRIEIAREGRPEKPYLFSYYSETILRPLGFDDVKSLSLDGPLDVSHRLCMALSGCHAIDTPEIEKVYPYGNRNSVRVDLSVPLLGTPRRRIVEIEQALEGNNKDRAVAKLFGLDAAIYEHSNELDDEVLFIFNLTDEELAQTIKVWRNALRDTDTLEITISYTTLRRFLQEPYFDAIEDFPILTPSEGRNHKSIVLENLAPAQLELKRLPLEAYAEMQTDDVEISRLEPKRAFQREWEKQRLTRFFSSMMNIYLGDFDRDGATKMYGRHPSTSIARLRRFLHLPKHLPMLRRMQETFKEVRKRQSGVTMYQDAISKFVWDTFLSWFDFGRGGPLTIYIIVPEVGGKDSDIGFDIHLNLEKELNLSLPDESVKALNWVLSAFLIHSKELGLISNGE